MVNEIRLARLTELVKRRVQEAILLELKDPRLGFLTVTEVKLTRDLTHATILWSIIGTKGDRSKAAHARRKLQAVGAGFKLRSDAFNRFDRLREKKLCDIEVDDDPEHVDEARDEGGR